MNNHRWLRGRPSNRRGTGLPLNRRGRRGHPLNNLRRGRGSVHNLGLLRHLLYLLRDYLRFFFRRRWRRLSRCPRGRRRRNFLFDRQGRFQHRHLLLFGSNLLFLHSGGRLFNFCLLRQPSGKGIKHCSLLFLHGDVGGRGSGRSSFHHHHSRLLGRRESHTLGPLSFGFSLFGLHQLTLQLGPLGGRQGRRQHWQNQRARSAQVPNYPDIISHSGHSPQALRTQADFHGEPVQTAAQVGPDEGQFETEDVVARGSEFKGLVIQTRVLGQVPEDGAKKIEVRIQAFGSIARLRLYVQFKGQRLGRLADVGNFPDSVQLVAFVFDHGTGEPQLLRQTGSLPLGQGPQFVNRQVGHRSGGGKNFGRVSRVFKKVGGGTAVAVQFDLDAAGIVADSHQVEAQRLQHGHVVEKYLAKRRHRDLCHIGAAGSSTGSRSHFPIPRVGRLPNVLKIVPHLGHIFFGQSAVHHGGRESAVLFFEGPLSGALLNGQPHSIFFARQSG